MASTVEESAHAQQMDGVYAFQRHIYDLTRKYYLLGRDGLIARLSPAPGQHVLEIGCGTARNLVLAARAWPGARFYGIDISSEMLKSARSKLAGERLAAQVRLARADAAAFEPGQLFRRAEFDRIFFSYTLSMIPDWQGALRMATSVLAEGGEIHIVDFGMQERLPRWFARLLGDWLARFQVIRRESLLDFCEELARSQGFGCECRRLYGDYARQVVLRRP